MARRITDPKRLQSKSKTHTVTQVGINQWMVTSGSSGKSYRVKMQSTTQDGAVTYSGAECTCPWGKYRPGRDRRSGCSHAQAVFAHLAQERDGRTTSAWGTSQDAKRQHRPVTVIGDGVILTSRKNERKNIYDRAKSLVADNPFLSEEQVVYKNGNAKVTLTSHNGHLWLAYKDILTDCASQDSITGWEWTLSKESYRAWTAHCQA